MIQIKNLTKRYGETTVLRNFTYSFNERGITCILGPSGCGKSTLFNLVAGFDRAYEGQIHMGECDLAKLTQQEIASYRRDKIGFVFQEYNLIQGYTVLENILLAAELNSNTLQGNEELACTLLKRLGIADKKDEKIENLSGGQKQRVGRRL